MSNWDKDLIHFKADAATAHHQDKPKYQGRYLIGAIFLLAVVLGSILLYQARHTQQEQQTNHSGADHAAKQIPASNNLVVNKSVSDNKIVHHTTTKQIRPNYHTKQTQDKTTTLPKPSANQPITKENQIRIIHRPLQLDFYDNLKELDHHNQLFQEFRPITLAEIKKNFTQNQHQYSYFFQLGQTNNLTDAQNMQTQLQTQFRINHPRSEIRIQDMRGIREYYLISGPYYALKEIEHLHQTLLSTSMPFIIYSLLLN